MKFRNSSIFAIATLTLFAAVTTLFAGCGGGGNGVGSVPSTANKGLGRAVVQIDWPKPTRAIPYATAAVEISAVDVASGACYVGSATTCQQPAVTLYNPYNPVVAATQTSPSPSPTPAATPSAITLPTPAGSAIITGLPLNTTIKFTVRALAFRVANGAVTNILETTTPVAQAEQSNPYTNTNTTFNIDVTLVGTAAHVALTITDPARPTDNQNVTVQDNGATPLITIDPVATKVPYPLSVNETDASAKQVLLNYQTGNNFNATPQIRWTLNALGGASGGLSLTSINSVSTTLLRVPGSAGEEAGLYSVQASDTQATGLTLPTINIAIARTTQALFTLFPTALPTTNPPLIDALHPAADVTAYGGPFFLSGGITDVDPATGTPVMPPVSGNAVVGTVSSYKTTTIKDPVSQKYLNVVLTHLTRPSGFAGFVGSVADTLYPLVLNSGAAGGLVAGKSATLAVITDLASDHGWTVPSGTAAGAGYVYALAADKISVYTCDSNGTLTLTTASPVSLGSDTSVTKLDAGQVGGTTYLFYTDGTYVHRVTDTGTTGAAWTPIGSSTIPAITSPANPSGETLGTITDIAVDGNYVYVLDGTANKIRVHLFHADTGKWLYSVSGIDSNKTPIAISASGGYVYVLCNDNSVYKLQRPGQ